MSGTPILPFHAKKVHICPVCKGETFQLGKFVPTRCSHCGAALTVDAVLDDLLPPMHLLKVVADCEDHG